MIYVFDTSSIRSLQHVYPKIFKTMWNNINALVGLGEFISTKEVYNELVRQNVSTEVLKWVKANKKIFTQPKTAEQNFVSDILKEPHFQSLIENKKILRGNPVADPFVISCARINKGTVVTEEGWDRKSGKKGTPKLNAAKIPNVCAYFNIPCVDLEEFMQKQGWNF